MLSLSHLLILASLSLIYVNTTAMELEKSSKYRTSDEWYADYLQALIDEKNDPEKSYAKNKEFIENTPNKYLTAQYEKNLTPLKTAAEHGATKITQTLLSKLDKEKLLDQDELLVALCTAAALRREETSIAMIPYLADETYSKGYEGETPLNTAVSCRRYKLFKELTDKAPRASFLIPQQTARETPFCTLLRFAKLQRIPEIIENTSPEDLSKAMDKDRKNYLYYILWNKRTEINKNPAKWDPVVDLLIEKMELKKLAGNPELPINQTPLHAAVAWADSVTTMQIVKRLTKNAPNQCLEDWYALDILAYALGGTIQDEFKDALKDIIMHTRPEVLVMRRANVTPLDLAQMKHFRQQNRAEIIALMQQRLMASSLSWSSLSKEQGVIDTFKIGWGYLWQKS